MSTYGAVHFRGRGVAVQAFENRKAKAWAVFTGKQFLASFVAPDTDSAVSALDQYLDLMDDPKNIAVYTIKVYDDVPADGKIKSNTPDDGSYNFRFNEPSGAAGVTGVSGASGNWEMLQILKKMDARIEQLEKGDPDEADEAPEKNIVGQIKDFLEIPGMQTLISGIVQKLTGNNAPAPALGNAPGATAPGVNEVETMPADPEVLEYSQALEAYKIIRNSGMPNILNVLQRLAYIAQTDQEKFKSLQTSINMFV